MKKNLFEVLHEMNLLDETNGTKTVQVSNSFISGNKVKGGASIALGVPEELLYGIMNEKYTPLLILVDAEAYKKAIK